MSNLFHSLKKKYFSTFQNEQQEREYQNYNHYRMKVIFQHFCYYLIIAGITNTIRLHISKETDELSISLNIIRVIFGIFGILYYHSHNISSSFSWFFFGIAIFEFVTQIETHIHFTNDDFSHHFSLIVHLTIMNFYLIIANIHWINYLIYVIGSTTYFIYREDHYKFDPYALINLLLLIVIVRGTYAVNRIAFSKLFDTKNSLIQYEEIIMKKLNTPVIVMSKNIMIEFTKNESAKEFLQKIDMNNFKSVLAGAKIMNSTENFNSKFFENNVEIKLQFKDKFFFIVRKQKFMWKGEISSNLFILTDISLHVNREKELEKEVEFKDNMISAVSHDLRSPVNNTIFILDHCIELEKNPEIKEKLVIAKTTAKFQLSMINDLLDINQIQEKNLRINNYSVNIPTILKEIGELFDFQVKSKDLKFEIISNLHSNFETINTDGDRLKRIIMNLVSNALKFTSKGEIKVKVEINFSNKYLDLILFKVKDTGIGIKKNQLKKLFKKFGKLENDDLTLNINTIILNKEGIGLGLSISNETAKLMFPNGGEDAGIKCYSVFGKGSLFYFYIPANSLRNKVGDRSKTDIFRLNPKETPEIRSNRNIGSINILNEEIEEEFQLLDQLNSIGNGSFNSTNKRRDSQKKSLSAIDSKVKERSIKVAVVDDDSFNIYSISLVLSSNNCEFKTFLSAKDLLVEIEDGREFDVYILDINMPIIDGFELAKTLKTYENNAMIVASTANEKNDCSDYQVFHLVVAKPFTNDDFKKIEDFYKKEIREL